MPYSKFIANITDHIIPRIMYFQTPDFIYSITENILIHHPLISAYVAKYSNDLLKGLPSIHEFLILSGLLLTIAENMVFQYIVNLNFHQLLCCNVANLDYTKRDETIDVRSNHIIFSFAFDWFHYRVISNPLIRKLTNYLQKKC